MCNNLFNIQSYLPLFYLLHFLKTKHKSDLKHQYLLLTVFGFSLTYGVVTIALCPGTRSMPLHLRDWSYGKQLVCMQSRLSPLVQGANKSVCVSYSTYRNVIPSLFAFGCLLHAL